MSDTFRKRVLLVDDDPGICDAMGMLLAEEGYDIATASDGLDALMQIKLATPDIIVSDLNMPRMSGHEFLSVVRLRFCSIPVIAMSGDYDSDLRFPGGVFADAFFAKGRSHPQDLVRTIADLIRTTVTRPMGHQHRDDLLQTPRYGKDSNGTTFIMLTCTECLRSFASNVMQTVLQESQQASCPYCSARVRYVCDDSLFGATPPAVSPGQAGRVAA